MHRKPHLLSLSLVRKALLLETGTFPPTLEPDLSACRKTETSDSSRACGEANEEGVRALRDDCRVTWTVGAAHVTSCLRGPRPPARTEQPSPAPKVGPRSRGAHQAQGGPQTHELGNARGPLATRMSVQPVGFRMPETTRNPEKMKAGCVAMGRLPRRETRRGRDGVVMVSAAFALPVSREANSRAMTPVAVTPR
ncbi:hypothetical protein Emed_006522 [Eimeria media]